MAKSMTINKCLFCCKAFQPNIDSKLIGSFALAANASGFLQVVVSKATAPDSEATDFSSAVASDYNTRTSGPPRSPWLNFRPISSSVLL